MIHPSTNPTTLRFGATTPPYSSADPHIGTDYAYSPRHEVYAPEDGQAITVKWDGQARTGNMVVITSGKRIHSLCHLAEFKTASGPVKQGQLVGVMGATGFVTGPHLHWALRDNGVLVDATKYVTEGANMTTREATAILDAYYWSHTGRKVKNSELDEYVPYFVGGEPAKFFTKAAQFDEVKQHLGTVTPDPDGPKWRGLVDNLKASGL